MKVLVTGGTGFVGARLLEQLEAPSIVTRNAERAQRKFGDRIGDAIEWAPLSGPISFPTGSQFGGVVNLMGESIAEGRWTAAKKKRIRESRVIGTRNLVDSILSSDNLPSVFVSGSAVGYYGDSGETIVTETHSAGSPFASDVCREWEAEANRLTEHGVRVVRLRIGIVLGADGGALEKMVPLFRMGLGGKLGNGQQWMPWIHVDDLVSLISWSLKTDSISGPVNAVAPTPVRNAEFTKALASAVNRPAFLPAPKFALRLVLGEFANSLFFSQRVVPEAALNAGFQFEYPQLDGALQNILGK